MTEASDCPKGYRFPKLIISHAVYLYHRFTLSYRDVQELMFQRGIEVSHETIRSWCSKFGPDMTEHIKRRRLARSRTWHLDEIRIRVGRKIHWLWRAFDECGEVLDILLQARRKSDSFVGNSSTDRYKASGTVKGFTVGLFDCAW